MANKMKGGSGIELEPVSGVQELGTDIQSVLMDQAAKSANPINCILVQYLRCKYGVSHDTSVWNRFNEAMELVNREFAKYLGQDFVDGTMMNGDFYTKWLTGGAGHALMVILSESSFLPGAGLVGMVHQLFTDKYGKSVANLFRKFFINKSKTPDDLVSELESIKTKWIGTLPEATRDTYREQYFLERYMRDVLHPAPQPPARPAPAPAPAPAPEPADDEWYL
jgi:hypothetical protein